MSFPILYVKNLPYDVSTDSLYELFGQYGRVYQIRVSEASNGTAFVIFDNIQSAQDGLKVNGINFQGRYIVATMYQVDSTKLEEGDKLDKESIEKIRGYFA